MRSPTDTLATRIGIESFSKFRLLINTTSRILGHYRSYKKQLDQTGESKHNVITTVDLDAALTLWLVKAHRSILSKMNTPKMKKLVTRVNDGIIEVGGRTERWMEFNCNKQLPGCHHLAKLIVVHYHEKLGHREIAAMISQVRSKYWIIGVRKLARQIIGWCTSCKRKNKIKSEHVMSSLPVK